MISLNIPGAIDNRESLLSFFFVVWATIDKSTMRRGVNRLSSDDFSPMCVYVCITFILSHSFFADLFKLFTWNPRMK